MLELLLRGRIWIKLKARRFKEAMAILGFPEISMNSRIANIKHCYTTYGLAGTFIRGVLRKRGLP